MAKNVETFAQAQYKMCAQWADEGTRWVEDRIVHVAEAEFKRVEGGFIAMMR